MLLHVVHETEESAGFYRRSCPECYLLPMQDIGEILLRKLLDEAIAEYGGEGDLPPIESRVVTGIPAGRIVEMAEREDVQAIVMINDQRHGLAGIWRGSIAGEVSKSTDRELVLLHPEVSFDLPLQPQLSTEPVQNPAV